MQVSRLHDKTRGVLKINAPMSFGARHLGSAIAEFMSAYPDLKVELSLNDRFIDPIEEGVDVTVRIAAITSCSGAASGRSLSHLRRCSARWFSLHLSCAFDKIGAQRQPRIPSTQPEIRRP